MELVGGAQEVGIASAPARSVGADRDAADLFLGEARLAADAHVLSPFVLRVTEPADTEDHELALAWRERGLEEDVVAEHGPTSQQGGVMREGAEDVENAAARRDAVAAAGEQLAELGVPLRLGKRLDARRGAAVGHSISLQNRCLRNRLASIRPVPRP